ncbi:MAG TPA: ABC-type transport auxiliary lipoprotein family protein [Syntrophorhabdaceae bacterium]|nr:ABC-type transport auxiliary lipoprotein family protein [Syntrophorhabdaceae bacterium]
MLKNKKDICTVSLAILLPLIISGCLSMKRTQYYVEQFVLDYKLPKKDYGNTIDTSVKFSRFSVAQVYNNNRMNYKMNHYKIDAYNNSRWRVNPGDLVGDYLLRDLRDSNIISVVLSYRNPENTRFAIEGGIEEFVEVFEEGRHYAVLWIDLIIVDTLESEITKKIIFHKKYQAKEPLQDHSAPAFAKAMSISVAKVSEEFIKDIYSILKKKNL